MSTISITVAVATRHLRNSATDSLRLVAEVPSEYPEAGARINLIGKGLDASQMNSLRMDIWRTILKVRGGIHWISTAASHCQAGSTAVAPTTPAPAISDDGWITVPPTLAQYSYHARAALFRSSSPDLASSTRPGSARLETRDTRDGDRDRDTSHSSHPRLDATGSSVDTAVATRALRSRSSQEHVLPAL